MVMAVGGYGWVGLVVVMWGLWVCDLVLAGSSNLWGLWVAMVVIGLAVVGVGYWFVGFIGLFVVVLPSHTQRERERERERERVKKITKKQYLNEEIKKVELLMLDVL